MKPGFSDALIGLQYGDEGKARIIDVIADEYDIIARFNGGSNAGHTIEAGDIPRYCHRPVLTRRCWVVNVRAHDANAGHGRLHPRCKAA